MYFPSFRQDGYEEVLALNATRTRCHSRKQNSIFLEMKSNLSALLMMHWARMGAGGIVEMEHSGGVGGGVVYSPGT